LIELQKKIRRQQIADPGSAQSTGTAAAGEYPVPAFGERDLEPTANRQLWQPPVIVRPDKP
jgi:hypothetical protein